VVVFIACIVVTAKFQTPEHIPQYCTAVRFFCCHTTMSH